jgi:hypothetical protein
MMETVKAAAEKNASTEQDAGVQYANCHRLSDGEKLCALRPKEGDVVNGKADRIQPYRPFERVCFRIFGKEFLEDLPIKSVEVMAEAPETSESPAGDS